MPPRVSSHITPTTAQLTSTITGSRITQKASITKPSQNVSPELSDGIVKSVLGGVLWWEYAIRRDTRVPMILKAALQRSETPTCGRAHSLQLLPHLLVCVEELGYASVDAYALAFAEFTVQVSLIDAF